MSMLGQLWCVRFFLGEIPSTSGHPKVLEEFERLLPLLILHTSPHSSTVSDCLNHATRPQHWFQQNPKILSSSIAHLSNPMVLGVWKRKLRDIANTSRMGKANPGHSNRFRLQYLLIPSEQPEMPGQFVGRSYSHECPLRTSKWSIMLWAELCVDRGDEIYHRLRLFDFASFLLGLANESQPAIIGSS